ncbi:urease accessory protein UreF [Alsobacter sp. SYSU BS001988]
MTTRTTTRTTTLTAMRMTAARPASPRVAESGLLPLLVWLSPAFPVGAFAYSHGLEWAVETGQVSDAASAQAWIADLLDAGSGRNDAVLLAAAHRAASAGDMGALGAVAELALALQPSRERRLEAAAQGNAFMIAVRSAWPCAAVDSFAAAWNDDVAYPVALGVAAAGHGAPLGAVLEAALLAFVGNVVSAVVRLGPIGQTDGQKIIAAMLPHVRAAAAFAAASSLDDVGGAAYRSDIASLRHETQYSRLFRS